MTESAEASKGVDMGDEDETAHPDSDPPPEPQQSVHAEPEAPADEAAQDQDARD